MKTKIYAIRDLKAGVFSSVFESVNDATAVRQMSQVLKSPSSPLALFPGDYQLFSVATIDTATGDVVSSLDHIVDIAALAGDDIG